MRISDWSSDVCSSDLSSRKTGNNSDIQSFDKTEAERWPCGIGQPAAALDGPENKPAPDHDGSGHTGKKVEPAQPPASESAGMESDHRSEEHTSALQSLMRISYAVFCLQHTTHYFNPH